jgi:serine/threonine protein kinase
VKDAQDTGALSQVGHSQTGLKFKLETLIGTGSFGLVYRARQLGLERTVAVKVLHPEALANMDQVGRFLNEARVTASLSHRHIVQVLDHGVAGEQPWIAYEFLAGPTLRALIAKGLAVEDALDIGAQIAGALEEAHRNGIIHRDVKPENVMEVEPGWVKITDFGLAKWNHLAAFRTGQATCLGTPAYVAPEMITSAKPSPATDQYALGVVLYEMLAGQLPFAGDSTAALVEGHLKGVVAPPSKHNRAVPPEVDRVVLRALAKAPADRYRTIGELKTALERCAEATAGPRSSPPELVTGRLRARGATPQLAVQSLAALAMVALLIAADPLKLRGPAPPPAPVRTPAPLRPDRAAPLDTVDADQMRSELERVRARQEDRNSRTKELASYLNPFFLRLADAAPHAMRLATEVRSDWLLLTGFRERLAKQFPDPDLVPDQDVHLYANVLVLAARAWCWHENMTATRDAIDVTLATSGDQTHDPKILQEMEARAFRAGGEQVVLDAIRMTRRALERLHENRTLASDATAELALELYWLGTIVSYRKWPAEARPRLAPIARMLDAPPLDRDPLAAVFAGIWELGTAPTGQLRGPRDALKAKIKQLARTSAIPAAGSIAGRLDAELFRTK